MHPHSDLHMSWSLCSVHCDASSLFKAALDCRRDEIKSHFHWGESLQKPSALAACSLYIWYDAEHPVTHPASEEDVSVFRPHCVCCFIAGHWWCYWLLFTETLLFSWCFERLPSPAARVYSHAAQTDVCCFQINPERAGREWNLWADGWKSSASVSLKIIDHVFLQTLLSGGDGGV